MLDGPESRSDVCRGHTVAAASDMSRGLLRIPLSLFRESGRAFPGICAGVPPPCRCDLPTMPEGWIPTPHASRRSPALAAILLRISGSLCESERSNRIKSTHHSKRPSELSQIECGRWNTGVMKSRGMYAKLPPRRPRRRFQDRRQPGHPLASMWCRLRPFASAPHQAIDRSESWLARVGRNSQSSKRLARSFRGMPTAFARGRPSSAC